MSTEVPTVGRIGIRLLLVRWRLREAREGAWRWIAWRLPRRLVYWAAIRVMVHATTGRWSNQIVPDIEPAEILTRWELEPRP